MKRASSPGNPAPTHSKPLEGQHLAQLQAALLDAFAPEELARMVRLELGCDLPTEVVVQGRTTSDITYDLVLWALRKPELGLQGLLAAAVRANPNNPQLKTLQTAWQGLTFTAPACPYQGMQAFTAAEKERFYGRTGEVRQALDALRRHPFLAIIGPSGSGKSSLLAAGLVPQLQAAPLFAGQPPAVMVLRPGAQPLGALGAVTAGVTAGEQASGGAGAPRLLVVDQFEELFTVAETSQREPFMAALLELARTPGCAVVLACRADFYANLMSSAIWPQVRDHRLEIAPLRGDALRAAITQPAAIASVTLAPALVERLLADAGDEPGVLPFIQETLVMLWLGHADRLAFGLEEYTDLVGDAGGRSGLHVALARHADHVYLDVLADDGERALARRILLRLVQFGEGRADTRRQQTVEELRQGMEEVARFEPVLAALTANRLLTMSEEVRRVDLAHEALIGGWPRLGAWIAERRAAEITRRRLEEAAAARVRLRQADGNGGLLDAAELAEAQKFLESPDAAELGVSPRVTALVADSLGEIEAVAREKERVAEHLRRRNQGLALALAAALVAVAVAVLFFVNARTEARNASDARVTAQANADRAAAQEGVAQGQRATAEANAAEAQRQARRAQAENLATKAQALLQRDKAAGDQALILVRDAVNTTWRAPEHNVAPNAEAALRAAVAGAHWRMTIPAVGAGSHGPIKAVAFSPDGKTLASGGDDNTVQLWDVATGEPLMTLAGHTDGVNSVAFSPDGKTLASGSDDNTVRLWDVATGEMRATFDGQAGAIRSVAFSPDGQILAGGSGGTTVRLWDVATGKAKATLEGHINSVNSVAFSPDGNTLASSSGGDDSTVRLWDVATGKMKAKIVGHNHFVLSVAFSPDGKSLASGGDDNVRVWAAATGEPKVTLEGHTGWARSVAFSPDGKTLASGGDNTVRLWDVITGEPKATLTGHTDSVHSVAFSPDGKTLASGSDDGTVRLWDVATDETVRTLDGHTEPVSAVAFSPDGKTLASGSWDGTVVLWVVTTGAPKAMLEGHTGGVFSVAFSPDGKTLASGSWDGTVRLWDVATGTTKAAFDGQAGAIRSVAFSPDGKILASGSEDVDSAVQLWNVATGEMKVAGHTNLVSSVAFSPDGKTLASGSETGSVQLWDAATGTTKATLDGQAVAIRSVAFSPDGKTLASASGGTGSDTSGSLAGNVRLWDVATGKPKLTLAVNTNFVRSVAFGPDGQTLAGSDGESVRLWDVATGAAKVTLRGHINYWVNTVAFSPDGKTLAGGSDDFSVRVWDVGLDSLLAKAEARIQRRAHALTDVELIEFGLEQWGGEVSVPFVTLTLDKEGTNIAQTPSNEAGGAELLLLTGPEQIDALAAKVSPATLEHLRRVDWERFAVLALLRGRMPSCNYQAVITGVIRRADSLEVDTEFWAPNDQDTSCAAVTFPYHLVQIDRTQLPPAPEELKLELFAKHLTPVP